MALVALSLLAAACGGSSGHAAGGSSGHAASGARRQSASLVLDFTPNAVHAGIYAALARHLDRAHGLTLHVIVPSASTDSIKLLETGRVNFAILDIHDLAIARQHGARLVGIMAIVERPLAAVIAAPPFSTPTRLAGQTVGITGVPSDTAVLDSIVAGAGGDPRRLHTVTIGFDAVPDLLAGRVAAATAFWNDEGVTIQRQRPGFHVFRVERYGAPPYPELVVCAPASELHRNGRLARALVATLLAGYRFTLAHPAQSAAELEAQVPGLDPALVSAELRVLLPAFRAPDGRIGELSRPVLERWAGWEVRFGVVSRRPDVASMFDPSFLAAAGQ